MTAPMQVGNFPDSTTLPTSKLALSHTHANRRDKFWMLVWVVLYAATLLLPTLGGGRVLTRHEVLAAEPAREMLHGGLAANWIIPRFAGVPREVKPPTTGWIIASSMAIFHSEAEWVVRLPAALTAIFTAALMATFAARWLGTQAGLLAGLLQATFAYILVQGRLAEADMFMAAAVCLAMYAFAVGNVAGPTTPGTSRWWPIIFYFGAGASCLIKGVGPIFIFPACIVYLIVQSIRAGDWRPFRCLLNPIGLIIFILLIGAWPFAAWRIDPGIWKIWYRETVGRAKGDFADRQPWFYYAIAVPEYLMPWLPFAIVGLIEGVKRGWHRRPISIFLLCWFATGIFILSLSAFKHQQYAYPMLPPVTLVAAVGLMLWLRGSLAATTDSRLFEIGASRIGDMGVPPVLEAHGGEEFDRSKVADPQHNPHGRDGHVTNEPRHVNTSGLSAKIISLIWLGFIALVLVGELLLIRVADAKYEIAVGTALLAVGGAETLFAYNSARPRMSACAMFATAWAISLCVGLLIFPRFDDYRWSAELARRASAVVPPGNTIWMIKFPEHQSAYYLRLPIGRVDRDDEIPAWLAHGSSGDRYAICSNSTGKALHNIADVVELDRAEKLRRDEKTEGDRPVLVRIHRRER